MVAFLFLMLSSFRLGTNQAPPEALVSGHPQVCRMAETLLSDIVGTAVTQHCQVGEDAHCVFEMAG
jgi:hypothetical protein